MSVDLAGCRVLLTGACGTVGQALLRRLLVAGPKSVLGIDHDETGVFDLRRVYAEEDRVRLYLGDVRDRDLLIERMRGIDCVIHAAAYKHVTLCEESPGDAIATNVRGTQNIIDAARATGVARVLLTSSDKAVNPTNVMGTSKLLAERLMTAAACRGDTGGPIFASTRFGNVLGSSGSVVPVFAKQIAQGGPITVTDRRMSRFVMTIDEAAELLVLSVGKARGGEVFVTKMHAVDIHTLAAVMRDMLAPVYGFRPRDIEIIEVGPQPGEKLYEELTNSEEVRRTVENDTLFTVLPPFPDPDDQGMAELYRRAGSESPKPYNSETQEKLTYDELRQYLEDKRLLDAYFEDAKV